MCYSVVCGGNRALFSHNTLQRFGTKRCRGFCHVKIDRRTLRDLEMDAVKCFGLIENWASVLFKYGNEKYHYMQKRRKNYTDLEMCTLFFSFPQ